MTVIISMLRGVNVGGRNKIKMEALRALYESVKLHDAQTYVQSGNVIFRTDERDLLRLAMRIEDGIEKKFGFCPDVILRTAAEMRDVIARNPFAKRRGIEPGKITRIPHGILTVDSTTSTGEPPRRDKLTFMLFGMLKHYKGVDVLIKAVQAMNPSVRDRCRFVVAGKAAMDVEQLISMSKRCGVFHLFDFRIGFIPDDEFDNVLKSADVFVYPYREIEASGALMLSLPYGKPIIASNIGLFSEMLVSGVHGRLVEPEDAQGLSEALEFLANDKDFRAQAGHHVKQLADGIPSWTEIADKTAREYHKVARRY